MAVLDTGCNIYVCGKGWLGTYVDGLSDKEKKTIKTEKSKIDFPNKSFDHKIEFTSWD